MRPTLAQPLCRKTQGIECALHIDRKEAVEQGVIGIRDGNEALLHDAGIVNDDIDAAKAFFRFVEKLGDFRRNGNIGLYGHSPPARGPDFLDDNFRRQRRGRRS
jgi:hypothetical protein